MNTLVLKALYIILTSLGLALVFNFLFFGKEPGVSVFLFTLTLLASVSAWALNQKVFLAKAWGLIALIGFFSIMPAVRANEFLNFLNICAAFGLLLLLAEQLTGTPPSVMRFFDYLVLLIVGPFRMLRRALFSFSLLSQLHSNVKNRDVWVRVLKGVLMAVPVLAVFAVLFSQADLAFSQFLSGIIKINITESAIQYTALLVFAFAASLGYLSYIFVPKPMRQALPEENALVSPPTGRSLEVLVFLSLITSLFLLFIGFQIAYLFGGENNIINAGFTYAEYARRGFFELLVVAFLSLLVLLAAEKYAGQEAGKRFLVPALVVIAEVLMVMASAFKRLTLYIDAYGMTSLRFYVAGFIILLLVLFALLAYKFIRAKQEQFFAFSTLLSVAAFIMAVNIVNPDAFIARFNVEHANRTGRLDIAYVNELSADAEQWKIELYQKVEGEDKAVLGEILARDKERLEQFNANWQAWNFARSKALKLLQEMK